MSTLDGSLRVDEAQLIRRLTLRLIPFLILLYFVAYIDRSAVGFAKLQMSGDLNLSDAAYGLGAGLFFIGYFIFEVPSNLLLERYGARRWFARILITWGVITVAMAATNSATTFYVLRFLLGAAEAGFFPGVLYYLTKWYPLRHRGKVIGLFLLSQPISFLLIGPIAGSLLTLEGVWGLHGWQWLFIAIGLPAVLLALLTLQLLPEGPRQAGWLSPQERDWIARELALDAEQQGQTRHPSVLAALKDRRVLLMSLYYLPLPLCIYGLGLWLPTLIHQSEQSLMTTGLIAAIPYLFAVVGLLVLPRLSDRLDERYWHLFVLYGLSGVGLFIAPLLDGLVLELIAICVTSFCIFAANAIFWTLPGKFLTGISAAAGIALINATGNLGGYLGPFALGVVSDLTGNPINGLFVLALVLFAGALLTFGVRTMIERQVRETDAAAAAPGVRP